MSDATVVVAETSPPQPAVEAQAEAAVEIARIEADAAVQINAQNNDAAVQITETAADDDEDMAWLRGELTGLRTLCETNAAALSDAEVRRVEITATLEQMRSDLTALALLMNPPIPSPPSEPEPEPEPEPLTEPPAEPAGPAGPRGGNADGPPDGPPGMARRRRYL